MKPTPRSIKWLLALFAGITLCAAGSKAPAQIGDDVLRFEGHSYLVTNVAFSPDGKRLLVQSGDGVTIHDATTGKKVTRLEDPTQPTRGACSALTASL
jgi:WD40 repeat protein